MPDESPQLKVGSQVWAWVDPGRWRDATVVEVRESAVTVRLSKMYNPEIVDVERKHLRPRDFAREGADRPRQKSPPNVSGRAAQTCLNLKGLPIPDDLNRHWVPDFGLCDQIAHLIWAGHRGSIVTGHGAVGSCAGYEMSPLSPIVNEQQFDTMLRRTLTNGSHDRARCPDAEVLAAYHDRTLDDQDRDQVEKHRFQCSRCDSIMGALPSLDEGPSTEHRWPWRRFSLIFSTIAIAGTIVAVLAVRDGFVENRSSPSPTYEASANSVTEPWWVTHPEDTRASLNAVSALPGQRPRPSRAQAVYLRSRSPQPPSPVHQNVRGNTGSRCRLWDF